MFIRQVHIKTNNSFILLFFQQKSINLSGLFHNLVVDVIRALMLKQENFVRIHCSLFSGSNIVFIFVLFGLHGIQKHWYVLLLNIMSSD